jgi:hypothetical protein
MFKQGTSGFGLAVHGFSLRIFQKMGYPATNGDHSRIFMLQGAQKSFNMTFWAQNRRG